MMHRFHILSTHSCTPALLLWLGMMVLLIAGCSGQEGRMSSTVAAKDSTARTTTSVPLPQPSRLTYEEQQGRYLYTRYCAICHGDDGGGDGFNAYNLDPKPRSFGDSSFVAGMTPATLRQIIAYGGRGLNRSPEMPPYRYTLQSDEIDYLVAYVQSFGFARQSEISR